MFPAYAGVNQQKISIHALREESDRVSGLMRSNAEDFNPRPPRGERHDRAAKCYVHITISIHALREESDAKLVQYPLLRYAFQSTPSARRATRL